MTHPRRYLALAAALLVATIAIGLVVDRSRSRSTDAPGPEPSTSLTTSAAAPSTPAPAATRGDVVEGLRAEGRGPVLSWTRVDGAISYQVSARGATAGWSWWGYTTSVPFGTIENTNDPVLRPDRPPLQLVTLAPGETVRWFVIAFTDTGQVAASSEIATFVYQPGTAATPAARPRRHLWPTLVCERLVPRELVAGLTLTSSTPCGAEMSRGCPIDCTLRDDADTRLSFYVSCDGTTWDRKKKPDGSTALPGVGRAAVIARDEDDTVLVFQSTATPCITKLRSTRGRDASIELARAYDRALTPETVWMPADWR